MTAMRWMAPLLALALAACSTEGKLPFRDGKLVGSGGEGGEGAEGASGGSGNFGSGGSGNGSGAWIDPSCFAGSASCNPLTSAGCSQPGSTCDVGNGSVLQCFDPPNEQSLGAYCDDEKGPFCQPGLHCHENVCRTFCCSNDDCPSDYCYGLWPGYGTLGVCY